MRSFVVVLVAALPLCASPADELFEKKVRPLFVAKCSGCHNSKTKMGGLDLGSAEGLSHAAGAGIVQPKDAEASRLYQALTWTGKLKMPPTGKLPDDELAAVRTWIDEGGEFPKASSAKAPALDAGKQHWAFQPRKNVQPPAVKNAAWVKTPVDRFILAKLEDKGLQPAPPADKLSLLRRVTFDLTGLPPTVEEINQFLSDKSPDAYARVIDRLLASPRYGERWGRHWLDVARYADSTGMDEDNLYPHAWRYRDYVIDAFQRDLPYNEFLKQQLAGDLLAASTTEERNRNLIATGFLAIGPRPLAQQDRLQMIYDVVDEQIDTVSKSLLGITIACARCHDHKFDPILTKDYYSLASIFASTTTFRNHGRPGSISYMYYAPLDQAAYDRYSRHRMQMLAKQLEMEDALSEDLSRENAALRPRIPELLQSAWKVIHTGEAAPNKDVERWVKWLKSADEKARGSYLKAFFAATPETIAEVAKQYGDDYAKSAAKWDDRLEKWRSRFAREALEDRGLPERPKSDPDEEPFFTAATFNGGPMELPESARVQLLRKEWKQFEESLGPEPPLASAVCDGPVIDQRVFVRGDLHNPGEPVDKGFPVVLAGEKKPEIKGSGRLQLAEWLTSPEHPLTSRVMVNRIWQWHFGDALVRTPNNWGTTGEKPTHPELLDYLANEFIARGWSIKAMHRLILLSNTYQMSSKGSREADPGNRLWTRFNRNRLSVEQIRDSMLAFDGSLDTTIGGTLLVEGKGKRQKIDLEELTRRSVYMPVRRGSIPSLFATFDFGDATTSSEGRTRTNVAPQALFIRNSKFVRERAAGIVKKLSDDPQIGTDADRVRRAYMLILNRPADPSEVDKALSYIASVEQQFGTTEGKGSGWTSFVHVLLSTNEFLYLN